MFLAFAPGKFQTRFWSNLYDKFHSLICVIILPPMTFAFDSVLVALTISAGFVAHSIGTIITAFIQWFIFISSGHACFNVGWAFKQPLNLKTDAYLLNLVSHDFWRQIITLFSCKSQIGTCSCHSNHSENNFKAPPSLWMQENFYGWEHFSANIFLWISCFRTIPRNTRFLCFSGPSNYCIYLRTTGRHFCDQGNVAVLWRIIFQNLGSLLFFHTAPPDFLF